jgi:hypothetical protein
MLARSHSVTHSLTPYESEQIEQIVAWKSKPINPIA